LASHQPNVSLSPQQVFSNQNSAHLITNGSSSTAVALPPMSRYSAKLLTILTYIGRSK
jgi:hypothetical protein